MNALPTSMWTGQGRCMTCTSLRTQECSESCKQGLSFPPAYPGLPWLMKLYTGHLDSTKEQFNYQLSRCSMTVECAFGHLKGRWHCLLTRFDISQKNIPMVISACCVLHNICEAKGGKFCWDGERRWSSCLLNFSSQTQGLLEELNVELLSSGRL